MGVFAVMPLAKHTSRKLAEVRVGWGRGVDGGRGEGGWWQR
jgi:hypothetical protein